MLQQHTPLSLKEDNIKYRLKNVIFTMSGNIQMNKHVNKYKKQQQQRIHRHYEATHIMELADKDFKQLL